MNVSQIHFADRERQYSVEAGPDQECHTATQFGNWQPLETTYLTHEAQIYHSEPPNSISQSACINDSSLYANWRLYQHAQLGQYSSSNDSRSSTPSQGSGAGFSVLPASTSTTQIRYAAGSAPIYNVSSRMYQDSSSNHAVWQPAPQATLISYNANMVAPTIVPSHSNLGLKVEVDDNQHETFDHEMLLEDEETITFAHTPSEMHLYPEELELSEPSNSSMASSTTDEHVRFSRGMSGEYGWGLANSDDDMVEKDRESDSDYTTKSPRRTRTSSTNTRSTKCPKHRRQSFSHLVQDSNARVHKRSNSSTTTKRTIKAKKGPTFAARSPAADKSQRSFPCAFHHFGCPLEFPNKNEWKRHVACQHLQLGFFRCDMDDCCPDNISSNCRARVHLKREDADVKIYNDFNRKDLFTQHCRRMHGPSRNPTLCSTPPSKKSGELKPTKQDEANFEDQLDNIRARCWQIRRKAPSRSYCGICHLVFDAENIDLKSKGSQDPEEKAWEERMEHLGRHYEKEVLTKHDEDLDEDLVEWGLRTGVFRKLEDGRPWLMNAEDPELEGAVIVGYTGHRQKPRRQSGRTMVKRRPSIKQEHDSGDEDAIAEED